MLERRRGGDGEPRGERTVREGVKAVLEQVKHYGTANFPIYSHQLDFDALTKQAIVARCTVEHYTPRITPYGPYIEVELEDDDNEVHSISFDGLQLREGEALCIILSLEKED